MLQQHLEAGGILAEVFRRATNRLPHTATVEDTQRVLVQDGTCMLVFWAWPAG